MKTVQLALLYFICLLGIMPIAASAQTYVINGSEVTDPKTKLIWRRCAEGAAWDVTTATCRGNAKTFTHQGALGLAAAQATGTVVAWRLPNIKELSSIVDRSVKYPSIDTTAFPATPTDVFWSATPRVGEPLCTDCAWVVVFQNGYVGIDHRTNQSGYVRLVRDAP